RGELGGGRVAGAVDNVEVDARRARADAAGRRVEGDDVRADDRVAAVRLGVRGGRVGAAARRCLTAGVGAVGREAIVRGEDVSAAVVDLGDADRVVDRPVQLHVRARVVLDQHE